MGNSNSGEYEMTETVAEILTYLEEANPDAIRWDGCDDAIVGIGERCAQPTLLVYDHARLVGCFVAQGMTRHEAVEWVDFNVAGGWLGEHTPVILYREF